MTVRRAFSFFISVLSLVLSGCATKPGSTVGSNVTSRYQQPETYWDHRAQQNFFETKDGRIAFTDHGDGPVLVMLHGVPTSSWMYRKMIGGLQPSMRVITIDFLGFGSSDKPKDRNNLYANENRAKRVLQLLDSLNVDRFSLLMHDMGGLIAWEMLQTRRENISNLIILNTIVHDDGFQQPNINPGFFTRQLMKAYSSKLTSGAILEKSFNELGLDGQHKLSEAECFGYVAPIREGSDPALYAFFTQLDATLMTKLDNNRSLFSQYDGNILVLWGEQDQILTSAQVPFLRESLNIRDDQIHLYPENAHFLAEEIPDELVTRITDFLTET